MSGIEMLESKVFKYEFDVAIKSSVEKVWALLANDVNTWWMKDFKALGETSVMSLNLESGGALLESVENGASLEWYRVQMCVPGESIYLVGYLAPDWGGPTVSMLKLSLKADGSACILTVSDALLGNITDKKASSTEDGWKLMFADNFKAYAEK